MKNNITITRLLLPKLIIILLFFLLIIGTSNIFYGDELFKNHEYGKLINIAESKSILIDEFLRERKSDAIFLSETKDIKEIFKMNLTINEDLMQKKIKDISKKTSIDVNNFILNNPNMTSHTMQNNTKFIDTAINEVGETGYTFILNVNDFTNFQHKESSRINFDYDTIKGSSPSLFSILKDMQEKSYGGGFYNRIENGEIKKKYLYFHKIETKTKDNISFSVAATTYIDEYTGSVDVPYEIHNELLYFQKNKEYEDLIFIDPLGNVIWTANNNNELGTNLITGIYNKSLLASMFLKSKNELDVKISESDEYTKGGQLTIFITSPVFDINISNHKKELIGVIALRISNNKIKELISQDFYNGGSSEIYIVNNNYAHISPVKFYGRLELNDNDSDGLHNEIIKSKKIDDCFNDSSNYHFSLQNDNIEKAEIYLNYANPPHKVLGTYSHILESSWCIIAEISYKEFKEKIPNENLFLIEIIIYIFILSFVSYVSLDYFFKIKGAHR